MLIQEQIFLKKLPSLALEHGRFKEWYQNKVWRSLSPNLKSIIVNLSCEIYFQAPVFCGFVIATGIDHVFQIGSPCLPVRGLGSSVD